MKKCENCNLILQDSDAFCPKCGGATVECDSGSHAEGETACNCGENCSCGEENCECGEQTAENVQAGPQMQFVDDGQKKQGTLFPPKASLRFLLPQLSRQSSLCSASARLLFTCSF